MNSSTKGFTIVELLIVIVVIGILAAITIVAYNGVSDRARTSGLQQTLSSSAKLIENARTNAGTTTYPSTMTGLDAGVTYANPNPVHNGFCATETDSGITYMVTSTNKTPHTGPGCTLINYITNPTFEANSTAGWSAGVNSSVAPSGVSAVGTYGMVVTHTNATAGSAYGATCMTGLTVGMAYSVSFATRSTSGTPTVTVSLQNGAVGGALAAGSTQAIFIPPTGSFSRTVMNWTAQNATTCLVFDIGGTVANQNFTIDAVIATNGENAGAYVDPYVTSGGWTWTGTANASTSTGPAF